MPFKPIVKRTGAYVAKIGSDIGKTISDLPAKIAADKKSKVDEEQRTAYLKAVKEDSSLLDISQKSLKKTYAEYVKPLVDKGVISQEEMNANLKSFPIARETDKLNDVSLDNYRKNLGKKFNELMVDAQNRSKKYTTDKTISGEMAPKTQVKAGAPVEDPQSMKTMPMQGGPGQEQGAITETDITERPAEWETTQEAPKTQQELMANVAKADASITGKEVEASTAYGSLQSQEHLDKMAAQEAKTAKKADMDELDRLYKMSQINYNNVKAGKVPEDIERAKEHSDVSFERLVNGLEKNIDDIDGELEEDEGKLKTAREGKQSIKGGVEVDYDAVKGAKAIVRKKKEQITEIKNRINKLKREREEGETGKGEKVTYKKTPPAKKLSPRGRGTSADEEALRKAEEALKLNPKDSVWLAVRKKALRKLGR